MCQAGHIMENDGLKLAKCGEVSWPHPLQICNDHGPIYMGLNDDWCWSRHHVHIRVTYHTEPTYLPDFRKE